MNLPAKPLANANVQRLLKPCTCRENDLDETRVYCFDASVIFSKSTADGVTNTQSYLALATGLLVARFRPSWVTLRGVSLRRESRYVCRQSLTLELG